MAIPSKKVWMISPIRTEYPLVAMHEIVVMGFFAKMEMRRDRMLEQMNQKISRQHQEWSRFCREAARLAGKISTIAVASMNPAPSATKYFR